MLEPPVRIENRTQLAHVLCEAAELEHGILSCYLFAAFSLKTSADEGLSPIQLEAVREWKKELIDISIQEMLHLGLVNNLLAAIGAAPHFQRPNLPTAPATYPASFRLGLRPFDEKTLAGFVFLERPEVPASGRAPARGGMKLPQRQDIFSGRPEYETVGHLYRGIEDGLRYLNEKLGPKRLFIGPPAAQAPGFPGLEELAPVTDIHGAVRAIQHIVNQGEGAPEENLDGHHARFRRMQADYAKLLAADPAFRPGRPVIENPHTRAPGDVADHGGVNYVEDPRTAAVSNLFDGAYEVLIQMFERCFSPGEASAEDIKAMLEMTRRLMVEVINPLGEIITTLPAGRSHPGMTAGPSFAFSRSIHAPPRMEGAWARWRERLQELSGYCTMLEVSGTAPEAVVQVGERLGALANPLNR